MSVWDLWPKDKLLKEMFTQLDLRLLFTCPSTRLGRLHGRACLHGVNRLSRQIRESRAWRAKLDVSGAGYMEKTTLNSSKGIGMWGNGIYNCEKTLHILQ